MDSVCFSGAITRWIAGESHSDDEPPPPPGPEPVAELGGVEHASTTSSAAPMTSMTVSPKRPSINDVRTEGERGQEIFGEFTGETVLAS